MTTETPPTDPAIEAWSDRLEGELIEAGMEPAPAHAYQRAFEFGMTRVLSVMATKQELRELRLELKQDLKDAIADVKREMRFHLLLLAGLVGAMFAGVFAFLGVILSKL